MGKYNYTNFEKQINTVLAHQSSELSNVQFPDISSIDSCISSGEDLLKKLGYFRFLRKVLGSQQIDNLIAQAQEMNQQRKQTQRTRRRNTNFEK